MAEEIDPFAEPTEEEKAALKAEEEKVAAKKAEKKSVGKSTLVLMVKPADSEVDLDALEKKIREYKQEGLLWGQSQREDLCYGLVGLLMGAVVTDDVSVEDIEEELQSWEDWVMSTEIRAFQKI